MFIIKTTQLKNLLILKIVLLAFLSGVALAEGREVFKDNKNIIDASYFDRSNELDDYILGTGDVLDIQFINASNLNRKYTIDKQGNIYFPRIKETYVRGLTIKDLSNMLEKRYSEFLISPEIYIRIIKYRPIKVLVQGEVRKPSIVKLGAYTEDLQINQAKSIEASEIEDLSISRSIDYSKLFNLTDDLTTISNAIRSVGGLTSYSDISKLELIRDIPLSQGGGQKKATIDFSIFLKRQSSKSDIRLFDGDIIYIPRLTKSNQDILRKSIVFGLTPRFINVTVKGKIENPGQLRIPVDGSLSDVMNLSGPIKPLSGKIFLIRYNKDGTILRKNINYSANSTPGSIKNPFLFSGDLISVKDSLIGKSSSTISKITQPLTGIFAARELFK